MKNLTALLALAAMASGALTTARADSTPDIRTQTVQYADLDTTSGPGAAVLFRRTKHAAENVCRSLEPDRMLALVPVRARCVQVALSNAIAAIDRPAVTAYAAQHGIYTTQYTVKIARAH